MNQDKCPFCGAEPERYTAGYECGTWGIVPTPALVGKVERTWHVSEKCFNGFEAHLAAAHARIAELERTNRFQSEHVDNLCDRNTELEGQLEESVRELEIRGSQLATAQAEIERLRGRWVVVEGLSEKSRLVIDDMRVTDRYNARVNFDVNDHLTDLENFLNPAQPTEECAP